MSGYDQYFKKAREIREENTGPTVMSKPKTQKAKPKAAPVKTRRKASFPLSSILILAAISALLGWWSVDPTLPERIVSLIEVRIMGMAGAEESKAGEKGAATKGAEKATSAATSAGEKSAEQNASGESVSEDVSHLEKLRERKTALDLREKELNELEEE